MEKEITLAVDWTKPETQLACVAGYDTGYRQACTDYLRGVRTGCRKAALIVIGGFAVYTAGVAIAELIASKASKKEEETETESEG